MFPATTSCTVLNCVSRDMSRSQKIPRFFGIICHSVHQNMQKYVHFLRALAYNIWQRYIYIYIWVSLHVLARFIFSRQSNKTQRSKKIKTWQTKKSKSGSKYACPLVVLWWRRPCSCNLELFFPKKRPATAERRPFRLMFSLHSDRLLATTPVHPPYVSHTTPHSPPLPFSWAEEQREMILKRRGKNFPKNNLCFAIWFVFVSMATWTTPSAKHVKANHPHFPHCLLCCCPHFSYFPCITFRAADFVRAPFSVEGGKTKDLYSPRSWLQQPWFKTRKSDQPSGMDM